MRARDFITEVKVIEPGLWTQVSARDLQTLAAKAHLRGFAANGEVFVWPAYDETHYGMLGTLGIEEEDGMPFFVHSPSPDQHGSQGGDDPPGDWPTDGEFVFRVGDVVVVAGSREITRNRAFRRMVGMK